MRTIIVIGFFFFNTLQGWAQEYNVQNILESNIEKTNLITWEKETNINVKSTDNVQIEHKHIYSRINQNSPRDQYKIYYSKFSKVKKINARIIDENGNEIRKIKKSEIQDEARYDGISLHLDSRIKVIPVSHNQYPYTVEISYQEDYKGIMFYPDYLIQNYGEHIVKSSFSASVPKEMNLFYKNFNTQLKPTIIEDGDQKIFQWSVESKTPIINESFTKSHYEILPMVITKAPWIHGRI